MVVDSDPETRLSQATETLLIRNLQPALAVRNFFSTSHLHVFSSRFFVCLFSFIFIVISFLIRYRFPYLVLVFSFKLIVFSFKRIVV